MLLSRHLSLTAGGTAAITFISAGNEPGSHACMDIGRLPRGSDSPLPVTGYLILTTLIDMYYRPAVNMMYKGCKGIKISFFVYQDYLTN